MKSLSLAMAAAGAALVLAPPAWAGNVPYGHNYGTQYQQPGPQAKTPSGRVRHERSGLEELRIQQIRKECRTYAFKYWRYHPDYRHCRYY